MTWSVEPIGAAYLIVGFAIYVAAAYLAGDLSDVSDSVMAHPP